MLSENGDVIKIDTTRRQTTRSWVSKMADRRYHVASISRHFCGAIYWNAHASRSFDHAHWGYNSVFKQIRRHSRPQSPRSFWPAAGIESSGSNHFERRKEITEFWLSGSLRICIYGACLKWLLPELSFSDRWSKGTRLWERDWYGVVVWAGEDDTKTISVEANLENGAKQLRFRLKTD